MADKLISELDAAAALADTDLVEVEQGTDPTNTSGKLPLALLRAFALRSPENVQTSTSYTLVLADAFKLVTLDNAAANTLTVPPNSTEAFPVGTRIDIGQDGAGQTTVVADTGVTIRTPETLLLRKRWAKATLIKRDTDLWDLEGNLEAAP